MQRGLEIAVENRPPEVPRLRRLAADFATRFGVHTDDLWAVQLALEEIVSNVIRHGCRDESPHRILVRFELTDAEWVLTVEDDACPFNPLEHPEPPLDKPPIERPVGGLGIHLVRRVMDRFQYQCTPSGNALTMCKKLRERPARLEG